MMTIMVVYLLESSATTAMKIVKPKEWQLAAVERKDTEFAYTCFDIK
jgi:hypothetical protein